MERHILKAAQCIDRAEALLIGASNGLSIAEGYHIFADNDLFRQQFGDFRERYGIRRVLDGCFFPDADVRQAFLSRLVRLWVDAYQPTGVMKDLLTLVGHKEYFILTTNADTHLELSGFAPERVFELEGTFTQLLSGKAIEDKSRQASEFIRQHGQSAIVLLELGIGRHNRLIKQPLMQLAAQLPQATYITLNLENELYVPENIADKSIALAGNIATTLQELCQALHALHQETTP